MYDSRGQSPRLLGEKYGRSGHTFGGFEYHFAICASSSLSQISLSENQSSNNAIKSPSICVVKFFVNLSSPFPIFFVYQSLHHIARHVLKFRIMSRRKLESVVASCVDVLGDCLS